jgi:hypothetical protein
MNDNFGVALALSNDGNTLVVGATREASSAVNVGGDESNNSVALAGAAYAFSRSGSTWTQQAYLKASNTGQGDLFGYPVALSGDGNTAVIGAIFEDSGATGVGGDGTDNSATSAGAVYTFTRSGTVWSAQSYIKASNTDADDYFGFSLAIAADGSELVVSAPMEDSSAVGTVGSQADNGRPDSGALYVFEHAGATWAQSSYLKSSNPDMNDQLFAVSMLGKDPVAGAALEDSAASGVGGNQDDNSLADSGAVYVFE